MTRLRQILLLLLGLSVLYTLRPERLFETGEANLYAYQAQAFLDGRTDIPVPHYDVATFEGRYYVPFPPFPAVVLLPFVALFGVAGTLPVVVALVIAAGTAVLFHRLAQKLVDDPELVSWLTLAFFFGTGYWYVLGQSSGVWFFAHVVGVPLILLAYNEALGRGREILVGLFVGLAFLTRQMYLASAIFLAVLLWEQAADRPRSTRVLRLLRFGLPVVLCLTLYLLFNAVRFGNPLDTGYAYFDFVDFLRPRMERFGLISLAYVPFNFIYLFVQGFHVNFARPMLLSPSEMDGLGTAITFASPFLGAAFFARWNRRVLIAAWVSVVVVVAYLLVYFVNGWAQVNTQRYTLDFVPLLMILTALGLGQVNLRLWKAAIVYAVLLNVLALVLVPIAIALIGRRF